MGEFIDEGPIVIKESIKCNSKDNYSDIRVRVYKKGFNLYIKAIKKIKKENITPNSLIFPKGGDYFSPIPDQKMKQVIDKIKNGKYKYQIVK